MICQLGMNILQYHHEYCLGVNKQSVQDNTKRLTYRYTTEGITQHVFSVIQQG
jgi:hypothetical protein